MKPPRLEVFVDPSDAMSVVFPRKILPNLNRYSEETFALMREWLNKCHSSHKKCPPQNDHPLPSRVIRVGLEKEEPHLIVSGSAQGRWAALSHCWGASKDFHPPVTTTSSLGSYCQQLKLSELPPTFQEAIIITRNLNLEYLWITLCFYRIQKKIGRQSQ